MIEFKIDHEKKKDVIKLELVRLFGDSITVRTITPESGISNYLITFRTDGTFYRHSGVSNNIGFDVSDAGCIKEKNK